MRSTRRQRKWTYGSLLATMLLLILVAPSGDRAVTAGGLVGEVAFLLLLAFAVASAAEGRGWLVTLLLLAVTGEVLAWAAGGLEGAQGPLVIAAALVRAVFLLLTAAAILRHVLRAPDVSLDLILGAGCVYLLLGLAFSYGHLAVYAQDPAAYVLPEALRESGAGIRGAVGLFTYFSITTLTTLGYGDMTPVAPIARSLSMIEAILGQLFVAIVLARLVGLHVAAGPKPPAGHRPSSTP